MRILHIIRNIEYEGGAEIFLRSFLKECLPYVGLGLYCLEGVGEEANKLGLDGVEIVDAPGKWFDPNTIYKLSMFIRKNPFDIIHTHLFNADYVSALLKFLDRNQIVVSTKYCMESRFLEKNTLVEKLIVKPLCDGPLERLASNLVNEIYAVSNPVKRKWSQLVSSDEKVIVIPCSPHKADNFKVKTDYSFKGPVKIGTFARLVPEKGLIQVLPAIDLLKEDFPEIEWHIYGEGFFRKEIEAEISSRGLEGTVILHGHVNNKELLSDHLITLDIYLHPSLSEGLSIATQEAMLSGIPIIAANVGGVPDLIVNGVTGLLCNPRSPKDIELSLQYLLCDIVLREKLGVTARKLAEEEYCVDKITDKYLKRYEALLR